ncbi:trifunctional serine/threonine-protein kinase/ATP-binding protein/sensor histidine kinase [Dapis sp. BLCC M229]|uniref:trifunctional serine/threonine-protein kinase/ATP-binding protein/sensor histidine kinase n=1 Tax=Dapis sp. BLCC M229 TaxID=3400188 RepID=UPI003CEBD7DF
MTETKTIKIGNYQTHELIHQSERTLVYRGINIESGQPIIIKLMAQEYPSFNELVQFRNQYAIAKNLDILGIIKPYSLLRYKNGYALIMEDIGAISLAEYQRQFSVSIEQFWEIALSITEILHHLHQNQIIHKDIKPANILIHPETKQVKLIDFSISSLLPKERTSLQTPNVLEGTLAYISPEQTGRMNRGIDYRSDFYSLGVTFYELLTGKRPFESEEPLELVHAHMAKTPPAIPESQVPTALANIVMKLMAKNAEERYQSALGLKYDLEKCRVEYLKTGKIEHFTLGKRDLCDRFLLPEKLYGREKEVKTLLDGFERVAARQTEMLLVAGFSGIGKTAVVNEVHKPITRQKGYFIKGKFDQFNRNIPFSAFVQAFRDLMGQLLGESDAELQEWKGKILEAVGENGQVLIDVIPELERIIGAQPPVPQLEGSAAQNRFNLLFEKFIAVFTSKEHPLTLFLDDLQWVDSASLNLLKVLMGDTRRGYLLLLGAYRDNEVFPAHPLMLTLGELKKQQTKISTITLTPLSVGHINQLVAETLSCSVELATPLTDLVYHKTKGNPFFTTQFLKGLYEDDLITFNQNLGYWECDLVKVRDAALTDDVVEFMAGRLHKLPEETQEVLKLAACIGNQFDLETLAIICETPLEEVAADLWNALREGLILPQSEAYKFFQEWKKKDALVDKIEITVGYRFLHDRVQQAAYSLIPSVRKRKTHLKIGKILLKSCSEAKQSENIFMIVNQLNIAIDAFVSTPEKLQLAGLNLIAGKKAKTATAYASASEYLSQSLSLLPGDCWTSQYNLTLDCYINAIESEYPNANFERASALAEIVLNNARNLLDRVRIYEIKIQMHVARLEMMAAVNLGLKVLNMLEVELVEIPPGQLEVEALIDLPEMQDSHHLATIRILMSLISSAYFADPPLMPKIIFTTIALSLKYGNSFHSGYGYVLYGLLLCGPLQDIELGYRYGKLALKLLERFVAKEIEPRILLVFNGNIRHWKEHTKTTLNPLQDAIQIGLEVGDIEYVGYASTNCSDQTFAIGEPLDALHQKREAYLNLAINLQQEYTIQHHSMGLQVVKNLLGQNDCPYLLTGLVFDEAKMLPIFLESRNAALLFNLYLAKGRLCYLFYQFNEALSHLERAAQYMEAVVGMVTVGEQNFYHSLATLATIADVLKQGDPGISQVANNQKIMQYWARQVPENYQHKYDLIEAEGYRVLGKNMEAMEAYDRAIAGAKENEYIQEEALANELAGKFYLAWGKEKIACTYLIDAYYCYAQWGAKAKTDDLEKCYPKLLSPILERQQLGRNANSTIATLIKGTVAQTNTSTGELLDLATLMKASRSLSQEIDLKSAIANFMAVIQENAGAETVAIMLFQENTLMLTAHVAGEEMSVMNTPVETSNKVPLTLVNQVKNTRAYLVLDRDQENNNYSRDDYIQKHQPQSVLCIPLIDRGQLIGILYLENNQVSGAFTSDRIEILNLLCSQATIALQNAQLYHKEQLARNDLQQALTDLQQAQLQLVQSEKMATLGNLVAGVAHEINNPVGFIGGNVDAAQEHLQDLLSILSLYQQNTSPPKEIVEEIEELEPDFIAEDFPKLIASMEEGCNIIRNISTSLRTFSRTDTASKTQFNLHHGIDSTLLILKYRLKANEQRPAIEIVKKYGDIVEVKCYPGQLNQVFMNLLANAIDALDESNQGKTFSEIEKEPNQINISTELSADKKNVIVEIADNAMGIPEEIKARIFEQGFTTKGVGKGTGLGMAIAHQIVTEKHGGKISCDSTVGQGTIFTIMIPR